MFQTLMNQSLWCIKHFLKLWCVFSSIYLMTGEGNISNHTKLKIQLLNQPCNMAQISVSRRSTNNRISLKVSSESEVDLFYFSFIFYRERRLEIDVNPLALSSVVQERK